MSDLDVTLQKNEISVEVTVPTKTVDLTISGVKGEQGEPADPTLAIQNQTTLQTNANFNIQSASTSANTAVIRAIAGQTGSLQVWRNESDAIVGSMSTAGVFRPVSISNLATFNNAQIDLPNTGTLISVGTINNVVLRVRGGTAPQTNNLQEWQNSAATILASISSSGGMTAASATVNGASTLNGTVNLGTARTTISSSKTNAPETANTINLNQRGIINGIGAFSGAFDYFANADRNPVYTISSNYGTVGNLFNGDLTSNLGAPVASLPATPLVITIERADGARINYSDVLTLIFTGHRLGNDGSVFTNYKVEAKNSVGNYDEVCVRTGVTDQMNQRSIPLHITGETYPDGTSLFHGIHGIRVTVSGAQASSFVAGQLQLNSIQLRDSRPQFRPAPGLGALDVRGGDLLGDISLPSTNGTKIGTTTSQKLGFFNATPIVQPANSVAINDVLVNLGLRASGGNSTFSTILSVSPSGAITPATATTYAAQINQGGKTVGIGGDANFNYIQSFGSVPLRINSVGNNTFISGLVGIGSTTYVAPTHSLTLTNAATGITLYNTADQTTNFERARHHWTSNIYTIAAEQGGTGSNRAIRLSTINGSFYLQVNNSSPSGMVIVSGTTGVADSIGFVVNNTSTASSGVSVGANIIPVVNQSGTAGYTALLINSTETATGSGAKNLIDAQVGGTSRFTIDNAGNTTWRDAANFIVGTTTGTKIGTATTQKISFWNATPIVQPTTGVAEAAYVENSGGVNVNDDSTFDGYTLRQVVKALRNAGILA